MSPSKSRRTCGWALDIFSFGAVLYEMATGKPPFSGETTGQVREAIFTQEPVFPRKLNPHVPQDLERVITKALKKKPMERYQRATELRADLLHVQAQSGRRWRGAALAAVPVLALLVVLGWRLGWIRPGRASAQFDLLRSCRWLISPRIRNKSTSLME